MNQQDFLAALPIEIVSVFALLVMLADALVVRSTRLCSALSIVGLVAGIVAAVYTMGGEPISGFSGMIRTGGMANVYDIIFCGAGIMTVLLARDYLTRVGGMFDEFYTLMMMSVVGMMLMAHATDLMVLFVGLEVMSICFYVMAGLTRGELPSNEASLKYFLLGSFASGFLLYGIALIYGSLGSTGYAAIPTEITRSAFPMLLWAGVALFIVGLAFKVAAFPFHQWAPDVYTGAPTVVTSFMSTAGKAGAFAGFVGFMLPVLTSGGEGANDARIVLGLIAAGSMLIGNLTAIAQTNVKRMLAYSSIAHAGYLMIGLAAGNQTGAQGIVYYLGAYLFMQLGAFGIVGLLEREHGANLSIDDYRGLGRRRPGLAIVMSLFMFSLVGLPPFAGFFGKYYLFTAAVRADMVWLAIVGVISSVISAWFYLGLIVNMFFREPEADQPMMPAITGMSRIAVALTIVGTLIIGFIPELILRVAR
jgi:NADH-quinone oxidoreductase subunit N